ncbi:uncharacterized protein LOC135711232 [Ochlerotatus camptorhynchus]|uniref:uncharacterized protein LOC135711232 n=1 Tax=Ochlerotatus camptorhynchus TaxID=644619 RepID=UPI0031D1BCAF
MASMLFTALQEEAQPVQGLYRSWRNDYREDTDYGTLMILQLAIDLTGYHYVLTLEDVENIGNMLQVVHERILKSSYQDCGIFGHSAVLKRLSKLLELLIAHDYDELLLNNIWLNYFIRLLVTFCESNEDKCKMVAGYLSMLVLVNLTSVREQLHKRLEAEQLDESESPSEPEKHLRYVHKVSKMMFRNVEGACGYAITLPVITDLFCRMLQAHPMVYVVEHCMLDLLGTFLQHRHGKMFQMVAACFRNLLNPDIQEEVVVDRVAKFFIESAGKRFTQSMFNYKSSEKVVMEVVVSIQRLNYGKAIFDEAVTETLRQQMFHKEETIRGYAIDFHVCTLCSPDETDGDRNLDILQHILKLYVQFDHSSDALSQLVTDLWKLEFFDDFRMLFNLLNEEAARNENHFMVFSVVHVINKCYALLMMDLEQQTSDRSRLIGLLKSFMLSYPPGLQMCISYEYAYTALLQSVDAAYHDKIKRYNVNVNQYYEELFAVLEEVARTGSNFYVISKSLSVIRSYGNVIADVEQMWTELLQQHVNEFFETRAKFNNRNIGKNKELTEQYAVSLIRLTAFLELDPNVEDNLHSLMSIMLNDCRLLDRMELDNLQVSTFHRLYKCLFFVIINGLKEEVTGECSTKAMGLFQQIGRRLKKRMLELMRVLIKQLQKYDESLDTSVHVFISLCDMLLMTQTDIANLNITELQDMVYTVEPTLLQKLAKFLLNYVFSKKYDWHEAPIMKQKQMLAKYVHLYDMHKSLPGITDTHYVVANFAVDSTYDKHLRDLMKVLHRVDPSQFCEVICQAAFQLLQVYKSEPSVKHFFKKFQTFALTVLTADDKEEYYNVMGKLIEMMLNHLMHIMSDPEPAAEPKRMLKLIEPLLPGVPIEERLKLKNLLQSHPEYERLTDADRKAVNRFVKHLNPLND